MTAAALLAAAAAIVIALAVGRGAMPLGRRLGLLDWPDPEGGRKRHARVTPLMGGTAVVGATLAGALAALAAGPSPPVADHLTWFALAAAALYLIGLTDDRFGLGPKLRLVFGLVVFLLVAVHAPDFRVAFFRFSAGDLVLLGSAAAAFTVLCLVGLLNAVNMADGKDGLVISLSLFWTLMLWPAAPAGFAPVLAALAAGLAVTLRYNMAGRLFLGDGGSYGLSALLGLLAIYVYNHGFAVFPADRVALLFLVPVLDTVRLITTRAARGRSPFAADRDHLHHHVAYRWGWPRGLLVYLALVVPPNLLAWAAPALTPALMALSALGYAALLVLSTRRTAFTPDLPRRDALRADPGGARRGDAAGA